MLGSTTSLKNRVGATKLPVEDRSARLRGCSVPCRCLENILTTHAGHWTHCDRQAPPGAGPEAFLTRCKEWPSMWGKHGASKHLQAVQHRRLALLSPEGNLVPCSTGPVCAKHVETWPR